MCVTTKRGCGYVSKRVCLLAKKKRGVGKKECLCVFVSLHSSMLGVYLSLKRRGCVCFLCVYMTERDSVYVCVSEREG